MKHYSIKPLEWENTGQCCWESTHPTSDYYILLTGNDMWAWARIGHGDMNICDTLDQAKAAAQADWEERISKYLIEVEG